MLPSFVCGFASALFDGLAGFLGFFEIGDIVFRVFRNRRYSFPGFSKSRKSSVTKSDALPLGYGAKLIRTVIVGPTQCTEAEGFLKNPRVF